MKKLAYSPELGSKAALVEDELFVCGSTVEESEALTEPNSYACGAQRDEEREIAPRRSEGLSAAERKTENAFFELSRLVADVMKADASGQHLRALSGLVAIQPLTNLLMSLQQEALENGALADEQRLCSPQDGGYV